MIEGAERRGGDVNSRGAGKRYEREVLVVQSTVCGGWHLLTENRRLYAPARSLRCSIPTRDCLGAVQSIIDCHNWRLVFATAKSKWRRRRGQRLRLRHQGWRQL